MTSGPATRGRATHGRSALITGVGGQDGSYLAELLLEKGYRVVGMTRPGSPRTDHLLPIADRVELVEGDLRDDASLARVLRTARPDEVYNLAGHSFIPTAWDDPVQAGDLSGLGVVRLLEAIRTMDPAIRFYQASSSEMFGHAREAPQTERTPLNPFNPYGAAKAYAHFVTGNYRGRYGLHAASGILFNHESPRRGLEFVTRKVTDGVARIALGLTDTISMGSLEARRDWGFAGDYVRAMWLILQQDTAADYVIATGVSHSVRELCDVAFSRAGLDYQRYVREDPALVRPPEDFLLVGDATKARTELGWAPTVSFEALIGAMVDADVARHEARLRTGGDAG